MRHSAIYSNPESQSLNGRFIDAKFNDNNDKAVFLTVNRNDVVSQSKDNGDDIDLKLCA